MHLESLVLGTIAGALILATLPLLLELLLVSTAALLPRGALQAGVALSPVQHLMILVPSHNEEFSIEACVRSIAVAAGGPNNIVVIAHNCDDHTAERAREAGALVAELSNPALPGKGNALVHGFDFAFRQHHADAVLIVDADSSIAANLVTRVRERLEHALVVQCRYDARGAVESPKTRLRALSFLCMNVVRPTGRLRLGLSCGILGNGFALRREVLEQVPYNAHSIVEDLEFHLSLVAAGIRTSYIEDALVSADVAVSARGMTTQSARWEGGRLRMLLARGPFVLRKVLSGHAALIEPLFDLAGLPLAMEVMLLVLALALPFPTLRLYSLTGILIIVFHLAVAIRLSPDPRGDLRALFHAPFYLFTKAAMLPAIFQAAGKTSTWVRTARVQNPPATEKR